MGKGYKGSGAEQWANKLAEAMLVCIERGDEPESYMGLHDSLNRQARIVTALSMYRAGELSLDDVREIFNF